MATPAHNSARRLWAVALAIVACALQLHAYNFTAVSESGTGYESQTWFYCGSGNDLDQTKIKNLWNEYVRGGKSKIQRINQENVQKDHERRNRKMNEFERDGL